MLNSLVNIKNKPYKNKIDWKKTSLWLPFALLGFIMVLIPMILILIISFVPVEGGTVSDNWNILTSTIWFKILKSVIVSIISTFICLLISYPFCYFMSQIKSKNTRRILFSLVSMPMWLGSLIIIVSLKLLFDKINGEINSTYGDIYVIIAIVYLYIPYMIIPLYNSLEQLPKNLLNASKDLGRSSFYTFFKVIVPFSKPGLISGITMVLLPSTSVVAVPQFLNNSPDGSMIGDIIMNQGMQATESQIALSRVCVLSVVVSILMMIVYSLIVFIPKVWPVIIKKIKRVGNE